MTTRCSSPVDNRGRIHHRLQRSQELQLDEAVPSRIESTLEMNTRALDGQRRSSLPQPNHQVPQAESPYRAPLSLHSTGSGGKQSCGQDYPWEGQPIEYPHENPLHKYGECLEATMDETNWAEWLDFLENYDETLWIEG